MVQRSVGLMVVGGNNSWGEDVWVGNEGVNEGLFLSLEEGVCDNNSADLDTDKILLQHIGFIEAEEVILDREKGVSVLAGNLHPEVQKRVSREPRQVDAA